MIKQETVAGMVAKLKDNLSSTNKKRVNATMRALAKVAQKYPVEFAATGENAANYPTKIMRVREYGTAGKVIEINTHNTYEAEQRAGHEYYNQLQSVVQPLVLQYQQLTQGPEQLKAIELSKRIDTLYSQIGKLKQGAHARRIQEARKAKERGEKGFKSTAVADVQPAIDVLREQTLPLRAERKQLWEPALAELRMMQKDKANAKKLKEILEQINAKVTITRKTFARNVGLWFSNYMRVEREFNLSLDKVLSSPFFHTFQPHYRYEDLKGNPPAGGMMTYAAWNGAGAISSTLSNIGGPKTRKLQKRLCTIGGDNSRFRLRDLKQEEVTKFGLKENFLVRSRIPLKVASIRNGMGWFEVVIFYHQPISEDPDAQVLEVNLPTRKRGLHVVRNLTVTVEVKNDAQAVGKNIVEIIPCWPKNEDLGGGPVLFCKWKSDEMPDYKLEYLPANIDGALTHALSLMSTIKDHLMVARKNLTRLNNEDEESAHRLIPLVDGKPLPWGSRLQLHAAYHLWTHALVEQDPQKIGRVKELRHQARELHGAGKSYSSNYELCLVDMTDYVRGVFDLGLEEAEAYAILLIFDERFAHLYEWSVREREKALRRRREIFRVFAKRTVAPIAKEIRVPKKNYTTRFMSEGQKLASPSALIGALKNVAGREGILFTQYEEVTKEAAPTQEPLVMSAAG